MIFGLLPIAFIAVMVGIPVIMATRLTPEERHALLAPILLLGLLAAATIGCMELTLRRLAANTGKPIEGLIGRPVANSGGDHVYTPNGKRYELVAFRRPFAIGALAVVVSLAAMLWRARHRSWMFRGVVMGTAVAAVGVMFVFWVIREITAWEIFI